MIQHVPTDTGHTYNIKRFAQKWEEPVHLVGWQKVICCSIITASLKSPISSVPTKCYIMGMVDDCLC